MIEKYGEAKWLAWEICGQWYHEICLGLLFVDETQRNRYFFVCNSHDSADVSPLVSDKVSVKLNAKVPLLEEDRDSRSAKRQKRDDSGSTTNLNPGKDKPNYVPYEGEYYHIAKFLELQQGKVYRPAASRLSRWMSTSRKDFYDNIMKTINPLRKNNNMYLNDFFAFWHEETGIVIGNVLRIVKLPNAKSSFPVFEFDMDCKDKHQFCVKTFSLKTVMEAGDDENWELTDAYNVMWFHNTDAIMKLKIILSEEKIILDPKDKKELDDIKPIL